MNKRLLKSMLLGVALAGTMVSCQKDEFSNEMVPSHEMSLKEKAHVSHTLTYWIDGVEYNQEYASQQEMISRYGQEQVINQAFEEEGF
jgi:hypothetical protein